MKSIISKIFNKKNKAVFVFFCYLMVFSSVSYAQPPNGTGCLLPNGSFLTSYRSTTTSGSNYRYRYYASPSYNTTCPLPTGQYAKLGAALNAPSFNINCGTSNTYSGNSQGVMYYYSLVNCPIDDYIPYILLGVGGLGFFFIRRYNLSF